MFFVVDQQTNSYQSIILSKRIVHEGNSGTVGVGVGFGEADAEVVFYTLEVVFRVIGNLAQTCAFSLISRTLLKASLSSTGTSTFS